MKVPQSKVLARRNDAHRPHPILSGVLVLTLISMIAAMTTVGFAPRAAGAQESALTTAALAPDTSLVYIALSLDTESDQWQLSNTLAERAGFDALLGMLGNEMDAGDEESLQQVQDEVEPFLGGEAALVLTSLAAVNTLNLSGVSERLIDATPTTEDGATGVAAIVNAADPDASEAKALELAEQQADDAGTEIEESEYEGVTIRFVPNADDQSTGTAFARVEDFLIAGVVPADLEPIIDTANGDAPALAESENFTGLQGELNAEFMLFGWLNGPALKEGLAEQEDLGQSLGAFTGQALAAFDAYTGFVMWADDPGFRLDTLSMPTEDAADLPGSQNFDSSLVEQMPADTLLFANGMDLGAMGVLDAVALAVAQLVNEEEFGAGPTDPDEAEAYAEEQIELAEQTLGFNLQTEFVDQMVGEFAFGFRFSNLLDPNGIGAILVSGVADPTTLTDSLSKISFIVAAGAGETTTYDTREVDGSTVNVVEDTTIGFPLRVEYGVFAEQFILGFGNALQDFVDGPDESLADNPQYQAVMATLPEEHGAQAYVDLAQIITVAEGFLGASSDATAIEDASEQCADYDTQEDAQAAYDEDPGSLIDLDQDFDGQACEDFFGAGADATPEAAGGEFSAIRALATVQFEGEGMRGTSSILYIQEQ
ncbi:MAG: DUF3352 domain-containing protein [Chloroflexota bacterium]|nr:DUF3352 domain-containing protein [Chloroflexota bacterium]